MIFLLMCSMLPLILTYLKNTKSIFLIMPRVQNLVLLVMSYWFFYSNCENISIELKGFIVLATLMQSIQVIIVTSSSSYHNLVEKILRCDDGEKKTSFSVLIIFFITSLILLYVYSRNNIFEPRAFYEYITRMSTEGSPFALSLISYSFIAVLMYSTTLKRGILLTLLAQLTGSKGFIMSAIILNISIMMARIKLLKLDQIILIIIVFISSFYLLVNFAILPLFKSYSSLNQLRGFFDYYINFCSKVDLLRLLPTFPYYLDSINDYIPGFSRLFGSVKTQLHEYLFPYEFSLGKANGMLFLEQYYRLGLLGYPAFSLIISLIERKLVVFLNQINLDPASRIYIFTYNIRLVIITCFIYVMIKQLRSKAYIIRRL